ncbi:MAG TPA: NAD-dependent epimerase/dehydratase family protein [Sphingobacteriaceae bacterium]|nr:NAD-dependent epimerase/dehydratase family protein [Sphingobacteriaceae bacterium]
MVKIVLTGSSGFVGQNLLNYLSRENFLLRPVSLRSTDNISDILSGDAIIHLAGKAHDLKNVSNPEEYYQVNYELTKNLYNAFLKSDARKFIFISSVKASADQIEGGLTEDHIPDPQTHYGKSKLMAEEYIQSQVLPDEKSYYILRPCMIHGPGNKGNLNLLYQFVSKGLPYPLAGFENQRSFLSIENLCFVIKEILERTDIPSGIYHLADDDALSTNSVISRLAEAQGKKPRLWKVPPGLISLAAKIGDKLHLPLNSERLQKLTESYVVSNEKIKKALGKELPVSARDGILRTAQSFKNS